MKKLNLLEWLIALLMLLLVFIVFSQVALRYLTYQPLVWTEEIGRYVFIWLSLIGAAAGTQRAGHFAIDFLPRSLPRRAGHVLKAVIRIVETALYGTMCWTGFLVTKVTHQQMSSSIDMPMSIPYAALPVAGLLLCVSSLRNAVTELRGVRKEPS